MLHRLNWLVNTNANIKLKRSFDNGNTFDSAQIIAAPTRIPTTAGIKIPIRLM